MSMTKQFGTLYSGREDFERGSNLLKESMENQHISFAQGMGNHLVDSLKRAKKLPNGRLDLYTIDESIRSVFHILVSDHFDKIYEAKK